MVVPARPRLADHVFARRHRHDGARVVVLHDTKNDVTVRIAERAWVLVSGMDGTRDLEGLAAWVKRAGVAIGDEEMTSFLTELAAEGLVEDGPGEDDVVTGEAAAQASSGGGAPDRPVLALPGFGLRCDGQGTCCRFYPSVVFSPLEAARARGRLPLVEDAGLDQRRGFMPLAGLDDRLLAVALVNGRCAYLEADLRCGIHRSGAAADKPLGCRVYPARFVDDGSAIRVSPWLECGCVLASGLSADGGGEPLTTATRGAELERAIFVERLPELVRLGRTLTVPRSEVAALSLELSSCHVPDGVASLLALAAVLDGGEVAGAKRALEAPPPAELTHLAERLAAIRPRVARLAAEEWRSPEDFARQLATALLGAFDLLDVMPEELLRGPGVFEMTESFYVRALLFGHQLFHPKGKHTMASLARDRAVRVLLGRALAVTANLAELTDPAFRHPLALVEACSRAYGLVGYLHTFIDENGA